MVISSSNISMGSKREFETKSISQLTTVMGNEVTEYTAGETTKETEQTFKEFLEEETKKGETGSSLDFRSKLGNIKNIQSLDNRSAMRRVRQQTLMYIMHRIRQMLYDRITGNRTGDIQNLVNEKLSGNYSYLSNIDSNTIGSRTTYDYYGEYENTLFESTGKVVTADGREISFGINVAMTRSFEEAAMSSINIETSGVNNLVDPLVINLNNNVTSVSDQKFLFDIDSDGILDSISGLGGGSGFIALDINEDGVINDGSELFGTKSGSGFADLSEYDEDGNGWIDENDSIFSKLLIWTKDENGKDELYHLKDAGVGALCLERVSTNFSLNDIRDNTTNAVIRETGIFLYENGSVGTLQHLDLAT